MSCRQRSQIYAEQLASAPPYVCPVVALLTLARNAENKLRRHVSGFVEHEFCAGFRDIQY